MRHMTKSSWHFFTLFLVLGALFASTLVMSPNSLSCCDPGSFFQNPSYLQAHEFKRMLDFYFPENKDAYPGRDELSFETYKQKIEILFKEKNLPFTPEEIHIQTSYYGALESNNLTNALEFLTQAASDPRVTKDWPRLVSLRQNLLTVFKKKGNDPFLLLNKIRSLKPEDVGPYGAYLEGAFFFYDDAYETAVEVFARLKTPSTPTLMSRISTFLGKAPPSDWIEDTARYMEARTYLIMAQEKIDGYESDHERAQKLNMHALEKSFELFQTYLKEMPHGRYRHSVENLARKFFHLSSKQDKLNNALKAHVKDVLSQKNSPANIRYAISEFTHYFKGKIDPVIDAPLLVAYGVQNELFSKNDLPEVLKTLDTRTKEYASYPGLMLFLKAVILNQLGHHDTLLREIPFQKDFPKEDIVGLGIQMIRVSSLRALGRTQEVLEALGHFGPLYQDDHLDINIYTAHLDLHSAPEVILMGLSSPTVIDLFLEKLSSTSDLEQLLKVGEKFHKDLLKQIKKVLTRRYLLSGRLKDALDLDCLDAQLRPVVAEFLKTPKDNAALLSLAKTLMETTQPWYDLDWFMHELHEECPRCVVMASDPLVPPLTYFIRIVENHKQTQQTSMIEAEALHYICGKCFHGSSDAQACLWQSGWEENLELKTIHDEKLPLWFRRLHKIYKGSAWQQETPYRY